MYVEGRATDYFTTRSGERIYNFNIENVILDVDAVYKCEVVGRKNQDGFEEASAFIVLTGKADKEGVLNGIKEVCKKSLDEEQMPVDIMILDSFPAKSSGKRDMEQLVRIASEK